jgi:hypothetical protein
MPRRHEVGPTLHQLFPILEMEYDKDHRAAYLEDGMMDMSLPILRPRTHNRLLRWDERYAPYIQRASFLELVRVVNKGLSPLNPHFSLQLWTGDSAFALS